MQRVRTNIITGFLGTGKTTAIRKLLQQKPSNERWAVLVNEFGEVGIDGEIIQQQANGLPQVKVKEVPGGCMCCAAGLPMTVAINELIGRTNRPDRLLIEPSGLGHPEEVIALLSREPYQQLLDLQSTITMIDARHLEDPRYYKHDIYQQQIAVADLLVANKTDLYPAEQLERLNQLLLDHYLVDVPVVTTSQAELKPEWLEQPARFNQARWQREVEYLFVDSHIEQLPAGGYLRKQRQQAGFHTAGWRFERTLNFDLQQFIHWVQHLEVLRLKALINTEQGGRLIQRVEKELSVEAVAEPQESRIEMICATPISADQLQNQLLSIQNKKAEHVTHQT